MPRPWASTESHPGHTRSFLDMTHMTRRNFLALAGLAAAAVGNASCSLMDGISGGTSGEPLERPLDRSRILIAYFSVPLTDDPNDMNEDEANSTHIVDGRVLGNTQYVAQLIQARTGAELFRIETTEDLPLDFSMLEEQALREQEAGARPDLKALIPNLADYDTIFLGYPIFWYDLPMPVYTFLERHDFAGKTIIPFSTHGGSRLSGTVEIITETLSGATVAGNAFTISRDDMDDAEAEVGAWLDVLG
ncbi:flavodoxin [Rhodococcus koreensis]|uniref:flavodoxin n=1 Tax=Rhodococcus koreensis TaxID=99653 RepID=UPI00366E5D47